MGSFIKKDLLVFWRDRKEILMALLLPIILILILNFAFSGLFNSDKEAMHLDVAVVQEDVEAKGIEQFEKNVQEMNLSSVEKEMMLEQAAGLEPIRLIHDFLDNPEMKEWISTKELSEQDATERVKNGDLDAIIKIPQGFTYDVLSSAILGENSELPLTILAKEESTEVVALKEIVNDFVNSLNLQFALKSKSEVAMTEPVLPQGGREIVEGVDTYTISQYFTIAISTLFGLFIAQTVAIKTVTEKRERVFNRILLTNSKPLKFLLGKTVSTFLLTWLQMMMTFTIIQLLLNVFPGKTLEFWLGLVLVISAFALTVAGLSALFTSIALYLHDSNATSGVFTLIIMVFGVLGGSFFPIEGLPELFQKIGEWTPNGLTQTAMIEWIQFGNIQDLLIPLIALTSIFVVFIVIGMSMFPKRGRI